MKQNYLQIRRAAGAPKNPPGAGGLGWIFQAQIDFRAPPKHENHNKISKNGTKIGKISRSARLHCCNIAIATLSLPKKGISILGYKIAVKRRTFF